MTPEEFIAEWNAGLPFIEAHTSGSTGCPKLIRLSRTLVEASARRTNAFFGINAESQLHSPLSTDYIAGKMMIVRGILAGCHVSFEAPSNNPLSGYTGPDITLLAVVPSQLLGLLRAPYPLPEIKHILVGGSAIDPVLRCRFVEANKKWEAWETYGMTETASHIALRKIDRSAPAPFSTMKGIKVSLDSRGCLVINMPESESIITNDLAEVISPSEFRILGRTDNVIITGGKKVNPEKLEEALAAAFPDTRFMLSAEADEKWTSALKLLVEGDAATEEIAAFCRYALQPHERPKIIRHVDSLPRTENGKLRRH